MDYLIQIPEKIPFELNVVANDSLEHVLRNEKSTDKIIAWINVSVINFIFLITHEKKTFNRKALRNATINSYVC